MATHIQIGDVSPRVQYTADGVQTQFTYTFPIFEDADLEVYLDATKQSIDFSIAGAGDSSGGSVTFTTAPANGILVTLARRLAVQRTSDFQESGEFRSKVINDELDYLTAAVQQVADDQSRSAQMPITESVSVDMNLPTPAANTAVVWNATADGFANGPTVDEISKAKGYADDAFIQAGAAGESATAADLSADAADTSAKAAAAAAASNLFNTVTTLTNADSPYTVEADPLVSEDGTMFICDMSAGDITINLPSIAAVGEGVRYGFLRVGASNVLTLVRNGTDTINDVAGDYTVSSNDGELDIVVADDATPDNWPVIPWSQAIADEVTLTKSGSVMSIKFGGVGINQMATATKPYDIAFIAGFDGTMTPEDVAVQTYGELIMCRSGSFSGEAGYAETAPTGAGITVDILKNGASIYSSTPVFAVNANALTAGTLKTNGDEDFVAGDRITFKFHTVGSTASGQGVRFTLKGVLS